MVTGKESSLGREFCDILPRSELRSYALIFIRNKDRAEETCGMIQRAKGKALAIEAGCIEIRPGSKVVHAG